ncbi:MAG TPA: amine oxidase, partial [Acetobacteraceae bacterium]|nr:amine oxidase [Acetobacteraceae bacterium]
PVSSRGFYHYVDLLGLQSAPFPNPLAAASPSTVIDLEGVPVYIEGTGPIPQPFAAVQQAWAEALESQTDFAALQDAVRRRDVADLKTRWNQLVAQWDERTFYDFIAASPAFSRLSFHHREIFGQVGFGTGGWDSDFPNSMLEILRVVLTELEDGQRYIKGGVEQLPRGRIGGQQLFHLR